MIDVTYDLFTYSNLINDLYYGSCLAYGKQKIIIFRK